MSEKSIESITKTITSFALDKNVVISKIVLFGSEALDKANEESDIDLMLISKNFNKKSYSERLRTLLGLNRSLIKQTNRPFDLLYYSNEEWENTASPLIAEAKANGKIIYS